MWKEIKASFSSVSVELTCSKDRKTLLRRWVFISHSRLASVWISVIAADTDCLFVFRVGTLWVVPTSQTWLTDSCSVCGDYSSRNTKAVSLCFCKISVADRMCVKKRKTFAWSSLHWTSYDWQPPATWWGETFACPKHTFGSIGIFNVLLNGQTKD